MADVSKLQESLCGIFDNAYDLVMKGEPVDSKGITLALGLAMAEVGRLEIENDELRSKVDHLEADSYRATTWANLSDRERDEEIRKAHG